MHIVLLVHGIRDYALWSNEISATLRRHDLTPQPVNYGRFDLFRFLLPLPFFRKRALSEVRRQLDIVREDHPGATISIIAHSFGTWLVANMLADGFDLKLHRIIFCGSVVPYNFRFELCSKSFTEDILNEVGDRDAWPALAQSITWGYGAGGTYGFRRPRVRDRWHRDAGHGYFLNSSFCEKYWVPFLTDGLVVDPPAPPRPTRMWVRLFSFVRIKYVVLAVGITAVYLYNGGSFNLLQQLHRDQQIRVAKLHSLEQPAKTYSLPYNLYPAHTESVDIEIFNNADILMYFLGHDEWIQFDKGRFNPTLTYPHAAATLLDMLIPRALAEGVRPEPEPSTPDYKRIAIVSSCRYFCVDQRSYTYRLMPDLTAEISEQYDDQVTRRTVALETLGDVFSPLNLPDLEVGLEQPGAKSSKAQNFRKAAHVPEQDRLFAFIDATVLGSGVNGVGFGQSRLYVNNGAFQAPFSIAYTTLASVEIRKGGASLLGIRRHHGNYNCRIEIRRSAAHCAFAAHQADCK